MIYHSMDDCNPEQIEFIETLSGLLSIPSTKDAASDGAPFGVKTLQALHYVLNKGQEMGFTVCNMDGYAGYVEFGKGEKEIAMLCHLDVVPAEQGWDFDPYSPFVKDGRIFGRGAVDDKGPAMACLFAMKSLKEKDWIPPCRIRLILGLDEESGSQCMVHYKLEQDHPDIGFTPDAKFPVIFAEKGILHLTIKGVFDPSIAVTDSFAFLSAKGGERANMIPAACSLSWLERAGEKPVTYSNSSPKATCYASFNNTPLHDANSSDKIINSTNNKNANVSNGVFCVNETVYHSYEKKSVTITGAPGHASMPEFGVNAISKAMVEVESMLSANRIHHPFVDFYNQCIHTTTDGSLLGISFSDSDSGSLTCNAGLIDFSADAVSLTLDIRYPVTTDPQWILDQIEKKCSHFGLLIMDIENNAPLFLDKKSGFVQTLLGVYNKETGSNAGPIAIGGGTYARSIPNIVAFGPNFNHEDDVAHQAGEYMKLDDLFLCKNIYEKAILALADFVTAK